MSTWDCDKTTGSDRVTMDEVTDTAELAQAHERRAQFDRNCAWLEAHASEVYLKHRGKCICVAGEEPFIADTPAQALALAEAAHPNDKGRFVHYIPREKVARV